MKHAVRIIRTTDRDGLAIVLVPVKGAPKPAKIFAEDFDRLRLAGLTDRWVFNEGRPGLNYVRAGHRTAVGQLVTVARLVAEAGKGQAVRYGDRDRLNLRGDNLCIVKARHAIHDAMLPLVSDTRPKRVRSARGATVAAELTL